MKLFKSVTKILQKVEDRFYEFIYTFNNELSYV